MSGLDDSPLFRDYPEDFSILLSSMNATEVEQEMKAPRAIMEYFSPAGSSYILQQLPRDVNVDTYDYFGEPVYIYSLKGGINDGFLTPFKVKEISTTIDEYIYTNDDDVEEGEIVGENIHGREINRIIEDQRTRGFLSKALHGHDQPEPKRPWCSVPLRFSHSGSYQSVRKSKNPHYCHRVTADDGKIENSI